MEKVLDRKQHFTERSKNLAGLKYFLTDILFPSLIINRYCIQEVEVIRKKETGDLYKRILCKKNYCSSNQSNK